MNRFQILLLEDDATDAMLTCRALERGGVQADIKIAESRLDYLAALENPQIDLVISDTSVASLNVLEAMQLYGARHPDAAFIVLSGAINQRLTQRVREAGAIAWLEKDDLSQLIPVVQRVLARKALPVLPDALKASGQQLIGAKFAAQRLVRAVTDLSKARDLPTIQAIVRRAARELNGADGATFVLRDGDKCYYADEDAIAPLWKGQRFPMSSCVSGWVMLNGKAAVIADIERDQRIPLDAYRPTFVRSLVMVPIRAEEPIGAIGNYWAMPHEASEEQVQLIQALADSTSVALENVRVYEELEQRVAKRTAELQGLNKALEEFSYFVSHDLRAPLRHIHAFSDILQDELDGQLNPEAGNALSHIKSAAGSMSELLEGLLKLAYSGQREMHTAAVDMNELVARCVAQLRETVAAPAEFKVNALPPANADAVLLRQVWINLIGNAVKYSSAQAYPVIEIGSTRVDGRTCYFVRDNGVGFDMAGAQRLFDAFQRLDSGKSFPGTGVGLSIVHRIVARHGGRVWAESIPGQGATFYFTLP